MKNVTVKVITISSQLLVVTLFLTLVFSGGTNNQNITIGNNNFDKMADKTMTLFKSEELLLSSVDTSVVVPLDDDTKKEEVLKSLNKAANFIEISLSKKIDIRKMPQISFYYDNSYEYGKSIEEKIKEIHAKENK